MVIILFFVKFFYPVLKIAINELLPFFSLFLYFLQEFWTFCLDIIQTQPFLLTLPMMLVLLEQRWAENLRNHFSIVDSFKK
jgi:hypothetical protein